MNLDPSSNVQSGPIKDTKDLTEYERWKVEIDYAESELKKFHERARHVVRRYVDERDAIDQMQKWFNLFYSNVGILKSAIYAQLPKPVVTRRFLDYQDQVARVGAMMLQRGLEQDFDDPRDTFHAAMKHCVEDRLVSGLGQAWVRLETDTDDKEDGLESTIETAPEPGEGLGEGEEATPNQGFKTADSPDNPPPTDFKRITDQRTVVDYIHWEDFLYSPCRVWEERRWVGRRAYMTKGELERRFGKEKAEKIPLNYRPTTHTTFPTGTVPTHEALAKAVIYEIWDRDTRCVYWLCKDYSEILDEQDDPMGLVGFDPCPKPMLANLSTSNCVPRPDYYMIQDQYNELDTVNNRITMLVKACKVVGVYDRASEGVQRMLLEGFDNTLIPVDNWAMFAEKGGVKGQIDWLPLEQVLAAIQQLYQSREAIKQQIYELTGIADIVRGASKASETLGAQEIKAKFASVRIKSLQDEVAEFAAQILRIRAELMVKHYDPMVLIKKSNILKVEPENLVSQAIAVIMSEVGFEWRIAISSDSMAQMDYELEKKDRIELMGAIAGYLEKLGVVAQSSPQMLPILIGLLKWTVAGFRNADDIAGMIDKMLDQMTKQPPQQKPDPKAEEMKAKMQMEQQSHQADMQGKQVDQQMKKEEFQMDMKGKQMELGFKQQEHQMDIAQKREEAQVDAQLAFQGMQMESAQKQQEGSLKLQQMAREGQMRAQQIRRAAAAKPKGRVQ